MPFRQYTTSIAMMTQGRAREIYSIKGGILRGIMKYTRKRVMKFATAITAMIVRIFKSILSPILRWIRVINLVNCLRDSRPNLRLNPPQNPTFYNSKSPKSPRY